MYIYIPMIWKGAVALPTLADSCSWDPGIFSEIGHGNIPRPSEGWVEKSGGMSMSMHTLNVQIQWIFLALVVGGRDISP